MYEDNALTSMYGCLKLILLFFLNHQNIKVSFLQGQNIWSGNIHVCGFYIQKQGQGEIFGFFLSNVRR